MPIVVIETDGGANIPDEPKILGTMKIIWHQDGSRNYMTDIDNPELLVHSYGDVNNLVGLAYCFSNTCENLAVVDFYLNTNTKLGKHGVVNLHQLNLVDE